MTGSGSGPAAQPVIEIQQALGRPIAKANHYFFVPRLANSNARNADARSRLRQPKHEASCGHRETAQRKHVGLVAGFGGLREMCESVCVGKGAVIYPPLQLLCVEVQPHPPCGRRPLPHVFRSGYSGRAVRGTESCPKSRPKRGPKSGSKSAPKSRPKSGPKSGPKCVYKGMTKGNAHDEAPEQDDVSTCWVTFWAAFWHTFWAAFWFTFWAAFWRSFWSTFWSAFWAAFWRTFWSTFWSAFWAAFWRTFWSTFWSAFGPTVWSTLVAGAAVRCQQRRWQQLW